ncbi:MAG: hypothetical protein IT210_09660, partial [Armatimonadetes bacterium]|nr:hypothetical protein [Armatimonadota bacterium]
MEGCFSARGAWRAVLQRAFPRLFILVLLSILACRPGPLAAQGIAYCNITGIETKRLPNAVQVIVQADGLMDIEQNWGYFFNMEALTTGQSEKFAKQVTVLPFKIRNARSRVGNFSDVGIYPVSHVEAAIPPDAPEGVGLDMRIVLFTPATTLSVQTPWGPSFNEMSIAGPTVNIRLTQDQRSLIILVTSDRRTIAPVERRKLPEGAPVELSASLGEDGLLDIRALNADLREVVRAMARASGRALLVDDRVDHIVSLSLAGVRPAEAMEALAVVYNLAVEEEGGALRLTEGLVSSLPTFGTSALESVRLHYISAVSARDSLPEFLLRYLHVNPEENALTV